MFDRILKKERRGPTVRPDDLPEKVVFEEIDYGGEHMNLEIPLEATVKLDDGDVFIFNDEVCVHGMGLTLEEAMEDFCGSFLLCYRILLEGGPRCNMTWEPIMHHVGDNTVQRRVRPSLNPSECPTVR